MHRDIKETLNAKSEYTEDSLDGKPHHIINQYAIKEEIGRGSYGAVHLATDQYGNEYVGFCAAYCLRYLLHWSNTILPNRQSRSFPKPASERGPSRIYSEWDPEVSIDNCP